MTQRGFTLIELLAALGIFALMSVMAYSGLDSVMRSRTAVVEALDRTATLQRVTHRLRLDVEQMRLRGIRDDFGDPLPALRYESGGRAEFTRGGWPNPLGQPRSTMQRVAYALEGDTLVRYGWQVLDRAQGSPVRRTELMTGVTSMKWRFLDDGRKWQSQWPRLSAAAVKSDPSLPRGAELQIESETWGEIVIRFLVKGA